MFVFGVEEADAGVGVGVFFGVVADLVEDVDGGVVGEVELGFCGVYFDDGGEGFDDCDVEWGDASGVVVFGVDELVVFGVGRF